MSTSEAGAPDRAGAAQAALVALLVAANVGLVLAGAVLSERRYGSDAAESPLNPPRAARRLDARGILRNPDSFAWLCDRVRQHHGVLFFGTSESGELHNVGAQLNDVSSGDPPLTVLPVMGMSPIHSTLLFARSRSESLPLPPLVLVINLVYFTASHDVIDDGWMSTVVRNPVFLQFDHNGLRQHLGEDVRRAYDAHFRVRRLLDPLLYEQYAGGLLYLEEHAREPGSLPADDPPPERYHFDGSIPGYDPERNVHPGYRPSDRLSKGRWQVRPASDCLNLKGVENTARLLRSGRAPALLLVLPVNRAFYESEGLDMIEFEQRYAALRRRIADQEVPGRVFVVDLYDNPPLDRGFLDRMHADAYGNHQLAAALAGLPEYRAFVAAVETYYGSVDPER
jgi:hypothetical protein